MAEEFEIIRANLLPAAGTITDNDMILIIQGGRPKRALPSAMKGKQGDPGLSAFLGINDKYILWKQGANGAWQNLLEIEKIRGPKGEKPVFRKLNGTLQMKYEGEPDSAYVDIFDREELKMKFSDLTPAEVDHLKLHFSDLTETDKAELMKPATDAAKEVREQMSQIKEEANTAISNVNTAKVSAEAATKAANDAAALANAAAGQATQSAGDADAATKLAVAATALAEEKAGIANTAAENADTAAASANMAKEEADKATVEANIAAGKANDAAGKADTATLNANTATDKANEAASSATTAAENANAAVERADDTIASAETATKSATDAALAANTAKENADKAANTANVAATQANEKAGLADTAALAANTAKEDAIVATGEANTAADRANRAAEAAEGVISGLQPDWNVTDPVNKNYIKNKPEIPTLEAIPDENTLSYVNTDGTTINFRIGDDVRVAEDGEYVFYRLYDLAGGKASWQESGSGTALPGNVYLTGANYYNESVRTIKQGYLSNE